MRKSLKILAGIVLVIGMFYTNPLGFVLALGISGSLVILGKKLQQRFPVIMDYW